MTRTQTWFYFIVLLVALTLECALVMRSVEAHHWPAWYVGFAVVVTAACFLKLAWQEMRRF
jgi:hypothetical protein